MSHPPLSEARTQLWLPPLALAGCVRGVLLRDTTAVQLVPEQRFNHYPATALCTISWWVSGSGEILQAGAPARLDSPRRDPDARITFAGPHTRPTITWNPGPGHGVMLLLMPDAMRVLAGVDAQQWMNRIEPAADLLPAAWQEMCQVVLAAHDDAARTALIEAFFVERWRGVARTQPAAHRYQDWAEAVALHAAMTGTGRSLRQIERRIRAWTGQPLRELRGLGRAENAFFDHLGAVASGQLRWPELATAAGYFDQSHLSRVSRRLTGFPPEELRRLIAQDEGFWAYRIWQ